MGYYRWARKSGEIFITPGEQKRMHSEDTLESLLLARKKARQLRRRVYHIRRRLKQKASK